MKSWRFDLKLFHFDYYQSNATEIIRILVEIFYYFQSTPLVNIKLIHCLGLYKHTNNNFFWLMICFLSDVNKEWKTKKKEVEKRSTFKAKWWHCMNIILFVLFLLDLRICNYFKNRLDRIHKSLWIHKKKRGKHSLYVLWHHQDKIRENKFIGTILIDEK